MTTDDIVETSEAMRGNLDYYSHTRAAGPLIDKVASLSPRLLACMHGASWEGDGAGYGAVARQPVPTGQAKSESFSASETKAPFTPVSAFSALVPRACTRACCRLDFTAETGHQRSPRPSGLPCRNQSKARGSEG